MRYETTCLYSAFYLLPCTTTLLSLFEVACLGGGGGEELRGMRVILCICPAATKAKDPSVCALLTNQSPFFDHSSALQLSFPNTSLILYHCTNQSPSYTMPKSKRAQRGAFYYFVLIVLYLFTSSELRACIHSKVTYVKRSPPANLALKTFILIKSLKVPMRHKHLG